MTCPPPKVFISYSHDSSEHQERVLALADRLRADGVDAEIDQYNPSPPESWPRWCERQIEAADFVLMVCTESYCRRVIGEEKPDTGLGVVWEAAIIRQLLYDAGAVSNKFIPVLFADSSVANIPTLIKGRTRYIVDKEDGYEGLFRLVSAQPDVARPPLGTLRPLPARSRMSPEGWSEWASPSPAAASEPAPRPIFSERTVRIGNNGGRSVIVTGDYNVVLIGDEEFPEHLRPHQDIKAVFPVPSDAVDRDLDQRFSRAKKRGLFPEGGRDNELITLGREALQPRTGSDATRRSVLLRAARAAARFGDLSEAKTFFAAACRLQGPDNPTIAQARLKEAQGEVDGAIRLLRDRDDPECRSVLMDILRRAKGDAWLIEREAAGEYTPDQLSSTGIVVLADTLTRAGLDERAEGVLAGATDKQIDACPFLLLLRALHQLALTLPPGDRYLVRHGLPLTMEPLRLSALDDELRRRLDHALKDLAKLDAYLADLELPQTRAEVREIDLVCRLMHPERKAHALAELQQFLATPSCAITRLHLAFAFIPGFDAASIGCHLATRKELGGFDEDELRAAFVIALHAEQPRELVTFISEHREKLRQVIRATDVARLEIQALAAAGDAASARITFDGHIDEFDDSLKKLLLAQIDSAETGDPVTALKRCYEQAPSLPALRSLVNILSSRSDNAALAHYGRFLFEQTGSLTDALVAARVMAAAGMVDEFMQFVERNAQVTEHEPELKRYMAWLFLDAGRINEASGIARELRDDDGGKRRDLDLEVVCAIDSADWESLGAPLSGFLESRERQTGLALIRAAQLAKAGDQPIAKRLIEAAVERSPDDVTVLLAAYALSAEIGGDEERRPEAAEWFRRSLELSGPEGPLQSFTIKELLEREQEWQRHVREVNDMLLNSEVPLSIAAPALRTTLSHVILRNLIRNFDLTDRRGCVPVPLFSGHRPPGRIGADRRIALDISAVLVLGRLNLLAKVIESYPRATIAAGVMRQLLEERKRIRYHQRSRVERARHIHSAIASQRLGVLPRSINPHDPLANEVGTELAGLLSAAAKTGNGVVLRPAPVHCVGSAGERDADMTAHQDFLTDMHTVLKALVRLGGLDERTEQTARRYFQLQDAGWSKSAEPSPERQLFLDGLALDYLQTVGLLDQVLRLFPKVLVHKDIEDETTELLAYEDQGEKAIRLIDHIRRTLRTAFERDEIRFGPRRRGYDEADARTELPIAHLLFDLSTTDVLVVDDRALAKEGVAIDPKGGRAAIATTLDVIEDLRHRNLITGADWHYYRYMLRRAGAMLVPLEPGEVLAGAERSGEEEIPELRSLRENVALARLLKVPRFPKEIAWFASVCIGLTNGIQQLFRTLPPEKSAGIAGHLCHLLPDPSDWVDCWVGGAPPDWVSGVERAMAQRLAVATEIDDAAARATYYSWLDEHVLEPARAGAPARYQALVEDLRAFLLRSRSDDSNEH